MPDAFFASSKQRKRKRSAPSSTAGPSNHKSKSSTKPVHGASSSKKPRKPVDEELDSDQTDQDVGVDDMDLRADYNQDDGVSSDEDPDETPAAKRLRLAKLYLEGVKQDMGLAEGEFDAAEIDKELISARLKKDVMEHAGKLHLFVADTYDFSSPAKAVLRTRGHRFSVTSAVASASGQHLFTSGKEGTIIKWDLCSGKKLATFYKIRPSKTKGKGRAVYEEQRGHTDEVLGLALSDDGKYLASGGRDRKVGVWDAEKGEWIKGFIGQVGHKDLVSALAFRKGSYQLYTGSFDRTIKVYDLSPGVMGYVETLFGHQDHILAVDALRGETCTSVGARDKTVRYWKIADETQLVFRGGGRSRVREVLDGGLRGDEDEEGEDSKKTTKFVEGSLETVAMIDESTFVTGGDSGALCLWSTQKKKPVFTFPLAHGMDTVELEVGGTVQKPRWVIAVASLRYSDLFASGSWDGQIRMWKIDAKVKSFEPAGTIAALGFVNSLQLFSPPSQFADQAKWTHSGRNGDPKASPVAVVAGMGQEPRMGRWHSIKEGAVNGCIVAVVFPRTDS
ncbi:WD40-repeat-containing domain protein [Mycena floridula]|nr:WD40-repeat-containing domain protein [Mycena floridula]